MTQHRSPAQDRSRRRRATLLDAAVHLLTDGGFAAVTHRAVARHAGLPLAATTYYFTSRDQLIAEAFAALVDRELATLRTWITRHGLPGLLDAVAAADRTRQLGLWELYVHAGRDPALQAIARRWTDGFLQILADTLHLPPHEPRLRLLYTTVSTLWLEHLVEQRPLDEARSLLAHAAQAAQPAIMKPMIHHLALRTDWQQAQSAGEYRISTLGRTLDDEGFIHCSRDMDQLRTVHAAFYSEVTEPLLVLDIDPTGLDVRIENGYPHLYGPLPLSAVTAARPFTPSDAGDP
ncbi:DUF952 domain-containing protein [Nonomuraea sp. NPDC049309]|uniref:DUF952 domain-containing protein n=1 Tax=Nonomuraea sp. NPDC049309 TaxID=3364350 RepID=UPI00371F4DC4